MNILHVFTHLIPTKTLLHVTLHHYPHCANEKRYQGETAQSRSLSGTWWHQHRAATAPRCCSKEAAGASTLLRTALGPQTRFSRCPHSRDTAASCERSFCECPPLDHDALQVEAPQAGSSGCLGKDEQTVRTGRGALAGENQGTLPPQATPAVPWRSTFRPLPKPSPIRDSRALPMPHATKAP